MKNESFTTMLSVNDHSPGKINLLNRHQREIFVKRKLCSLCNEIGRKSYFYYQTTRRLIRMCTIVSWINWLLPSSRNSQNCRLKKMLYSITTTPDHVKLQVWSSARNCYNLDEMCYHIHRTLLISGTIGLPFVSVSTKLNDVNIDSNESVKNYLFQFFANRKKDFYKCGIFVLPKKMAKDIRKK